ncbi:pseudouridine synthase [Lipomyces japonicus]|uniref:pseudouridine synthase n=1 Tax=Lipomyces japonicus TaxID=56871 RepID=UPI0034CF242F
MIVRGIFRLAQGINQRTCDKHFSTCLTIQKSERKKFAMESSNYELWTKKALIDRIKALEHLNSQTIQDSKLAIKPGDKVKTSAKRPRPFDFSRHSTRFIALRFAYLGWNYHGLNILLQDPAPPTVEGELLKAMETCKLIESATDLKACEFSRCGRTDKGVSALSQVVSLRVRSRLNPEEQANEDNDSKELSYIVMLNKLLRPDIRVYQVCLHPPEGFDARFSCKSRHYKYFFTSYKHEPLDIQAMRKAITYLIGEHDFRNFCRVDGSKQIDNYARTILRASISPMDLKVTESDDEVFYVFDLQGTAFLWHQVRCIVAILFLVGQRHEPPEIIRDLLDVDKFASKPLYDMAADIPLLLYNCEFGDNVKWQSIADLALPDEAEKQTSGLRIDVEKTWTDGAIRNHLQSIVRDRIFELTPRFAIKDTSTKTQVALGNGQVKYLTEYVPLAKRERMDHFSVLNKRWLERAVRTGKRDSDNNRIEREQSDLS